MTIDHGKDVTGLVSAAVYPGDVAAMSDLI